MNRLARMHRTVCATVLALVVAETVIGVVAKWPAQFGGTGDPSKVGTRWVSKGTALSPPLFLMIALAVALALLATGTSVTRARIGAALATVAGVVMTVGALGELLAARTPDVPAGAQDAAVIGIVLSLAVVVSGIGFLWRPREPESARAAA